MIILDKHIRLSQIILDSYVWLSTILDKYFWLTILDNKMGLSWVNLRLIEVVTGIFDGQMLKKYKIRQVQI